MANRSGSYGSASPRGGERTNAFSYDDTARPVRAYARPDSCIREDVCECMAGDPLLDASAIEVQVEKGEVTLTGTVAEPSERHRARSVAEQVHGVKSVRDDLAVKTRGM